MRPGAEAHTDLGEMTGKLMPEGPTGLSRMGAGPGSCVCPRQERARCAASSEGTGWAVVAELEEVRPESGGSEGGCVPVRDSEPESEDGGP